MKLFKMFKRGQKGFTLVELMVVMAIMAVLATIVVPAVTGTKGPAESAQFKGDANAVQSAAAKFNNDSALGKNVWPEYTDIASGYSSEASAITIAIGAQPDKDLARTAINWSAPTKIRNGTGSLVPVTFVPDFVPNAPASANATDTSAGSKHVYIWLLKVGSGTDTPTRTVEVYKLDDGGTTYSKVN